MNDSEASSALAALGWDAAFAAAFEDVRAARPERLLSPARVVAEHRGGYVVSAGAGERAATLAGRLRHETGGDPARLPSVGDWVAAAGIAEADADGPAVIHALLPRRGAIARKAAGRESVVQVAAANVDVVLLAAPLPDGVNARRLERLAMLAWEGGAAPVVVLTKLDLCDPPALARALHGARGAVPGVDVLALSAERGDGMDAMLPLLAAGRTAVLLGASGAGKSTLVNRLLGAERLRTAAVREGDAKGRHTTTHRELVRLASGALLIDTPGIREVQLWGGGDAHEAAFEEVGELARACRFADCAHDREPECAVRTALEQGVLDPERLDAWRALGRELAWLARRVDERAAREAHARVKSIHRAARVQSRRKYE